MEADLSRYYQLDIRDLWVIEAGMRRLTLRMIWVRVTHLPPDSSTARALGGGGWTVHDYLVSDLWSALAGRAHPARPAQAVRVADPARLAAAKRRQRSRARQIKRGEIT